MDRADLALLGALLSIAFVIGMAAIAKPLAAMIAAGPSNFGSVADWALVTLTVIAIFAATLVGLYAVQFQRNRDSALADAFCLRMMPTVVFVISDIKNVRRFAEKYEYGIGFSLAPAAILDLNDAEINERVAEHVKVSMTIPTVVPSRPVEQVVAFPQHVLAAVEQLEQFLGLYHRKLATYAPHLPSIGADAEAKAVYISEFKNFHANIEKLAQEVMDYVAPRNDVVVNKGKSSRQSLKRSEKG